jgi:hypothetical protein
LRIPRIAPITNLVESLRKSGRGDIPYVAPIYGGIHARLLTVLASPATTACATRGGTGFVCIANPNRTAANLKDLLTDAGIQPRDMVPWNACPWFTEQVSAAELELGIEPWLQLMALLPALRVIMLLGGTAQDGWERLLKRQPELASRPGLLVIRSYSPGPGALRHPDPAERERRQQDLRDAFRRAAAAIR